MGGILAQASSIIERIEELNTLLRVKESTLKLREKELGELEEIWKAIQIELESANESFFHKMREII